MEYILGVDGGGTKTVALLGDLDGNVLARGVSGLIQYQCGGVRCGLLGIEKRPDMALLEIIREKYPRCVWDWQGQDEKKILSNSIIGQSINFQRQSVKVVSDAEILLDGKRAIRSGTGVDLRHGLHCLWANGNGRTYPRGRPGAICLAMKAVGMPLVLQRCGR